MKRILLILLPLFFQASISFSQTAIRLVDVPLHIGDSVSVCGKVFSTNYLPDVRMQPTFLNLGAAYPNDTLTVLIWKHAKDRFSYKPEETLLNKVICVTGKIVSYKGKPQIVVQKPEQIQLKQ